MRTIIYNGDALEVLKTLPPESVNMCVTSPPYYALRDYGVDGQIGLEKTPEEYIQKLVDVFHEVKRVLKDDGTLWVNIGDSYWGSGSRGCNFTEHDDWNGQINKGNRGTQDLSGVPKLVGRSGTIKNKDLIGIPWMLAFALRADGWYLRQDIIWSKKNCMPESVTDRCTKSHEYIFLLSKKQKYYFDHKSMQEEAVYTMDMRPSALVRAREYGYATKDNLNPEAYRKQEKRYGGNKYTATPEAFFRTKSGNAYNYTGLRNKRDVWSIATKPYSGAHFATFPEALVLPCVLAGSSTGGWYSIRSAARERLALSATRTKGITSASSLTLSM